MELEKAIMKPFAIPKLFVASSNIIANAYLIHTLKRLNKITNISYKLVALLSISDISVGVASLILEMIYWLIPAEHFLIAKICETVLVHTPALLSGMLVGFIAIDRYIHLRYPSDYSVMVSKKRVMLVAVYILVVTAVAIVAELFALIKDQLFYSSLLWSAIIVLGGIVANVLYIRIYRIAHARTQQQPPQHRLEQVDNGVPVGNDNNHEAAMVSGDVTCYRELSKAVLYVILAYVINYFPFAVVAPIRHHQRFSNNPSVITAYFAGGLVACFNSTVNAIIFMIFNTGIRRYTKQIVCNAFRFGS